jgi:hypothetical protein
MNKHHPTICCYCGRGGARTRHAGQIAHVRCIPGERGEKARQRILVADRPRVLTPIPPSEFRTVLAPGVAWPFA